MANVDQKSKNGRVASPRLILTCVWHDRLGELQNAAELPPPLKADIEQFFLSTAFFTGKHPRIKGWTGRKDAQALIPKCTRA